MSRINARAIIVLAALLFIFSLPQATVQPAKAVSQNISTVYISPLSTCCAVPGTPFTINDGFTISIVLNLVAGQSMNQFDVRVDYTNAFLPVYNTGILKLQSITYSNNIFSSSQSVYVNAQCLDGTGVSGTGGCARDDYPGPGQFHFAETSLNKLDGPFNAVLFNAHFQVKGTGSSMFLINRANIGNPFSDPSTPQVPNPQFIPVLSQDSVFGNAVVTAFFNYQTTDPGTSPSVLPTVPVAFDASGSFVANNSTMPITRYSWDFGDSTSTVIASIPTTQHAFALAAKYQVRLQVWDKRNETDIASRQVKVLPALGNLTMFVEDTSGNLIRAGVTIRMFNSSSAVSPTVTKTVDNFGQAQFNAMIPGNYYVTFSGAGIETSSKTESITPGWAKQDTVHLKTLTSSSTDNAPLIFIGTILGGLAIVTAAIVVKKRQQVQSRKPIPAKRPKK